MSRLEAHRLLARLVSRGEGLGGRQADDDHWDPSSLSSSRLNLGQARLDAKPPRRDLTDAQTNDGDGSNGQSHLSLEKLSENRFIELACHCRWLSLVA